MTTRTAGYGAGAVCAFTACKQKENDDDDGRATSTATAAAGTRNGTQYRQRPTPSRTRAGDRGIGPSVGFDTDQLEGHYKYISRRNRAIRVSSRAVSEISGDGHLEDVAFAHDGERQCKALDQLAHVVLLRRRALPRRVKRWAKGGLHLVLRRSACVVDFDLRDGGRRRKPSAHLADSDLQAAWQHPNPWLQTVLVEVRLTDCIVCAACNTTTTGGWCDATTGGWCDASARRRRGASTCSCERDCLVCAGVAACCTDAEEREGSRRRCGHCQGCVVAAIAGGRVEGVLATACICEVEYLSRGVRSTILLASHRQRVPSCWRCPVYIRAISTGTAPQSTNSKTPRVAMD